MKNNTKDQKNNPLYETVTLLLQTKLQKFKNTTLTDGVCIEIYNEIFKTLVDIIKASDLKLTNESTNYISQTIYSAVELNKNCHLNPNIFTELAKLENIEKIDLLKIAMFLQGSDFLADVVNELKKR